MNAKRFREASKAAEYWLTILGFIPLYGNNKPPAVDKLYPLLIPSGGFPSAKTLSESLGKHQQAIHDAKESLDAHTEGGDIVWPREHGWGAIGTGSYKNILPEIWPNAHEAALGIAHLALDMLVAPISDINDAAEQTKLARRLLRDRWKHFETLTVDYVCRLQKRIQRERAKVLTERAEELSYDGPSLLDRALAAVTPNQGEILKYLWNKGTATFDALKGIPGAWRDVPSHDAILAALKKMKGRLESKSIFIVEEISERKRRITIKLPTD
jgi:hypothetical protein